MTGRRIGVVIADDYEFLPFVEELRSCQPVEGVLRGKPCVRARVGAHEIVAVKCGIGKVNAAASAAFLIADENCGVIMNIGLSGAVSRHRKGDVVVGTSFTECDFDLTPLGRAPGEKPQDVYVYPADETLMRAALAVPGVTQAVCGCGDVFLSDPVRKELYRDVFGITEFDMETGAIASVCHDAGVPFLSLRQISDDASDEAADSYTEMNDRCEKTLTQILLTVIEGLS